MVFGDKFNCIVIMGPSTKNVVLQARWFLRTGLSRHVPGYYCIVFTLLTAQCLLKIRHAWFTGGNYRDSHISTQRSIALEIHSGRACRGWDTGKRYRNHTLAALITVWAINGVDSHTVISVTSTFEFSTQNVFIFHVIYNWGIAHATCGMF